MQPIERYGLIALLFLVVTVVAVVLWDRDPELVQVADGTRGAAQGQGPGSAAPAPTRGESTSMRGQPPVASQRPSGLVALEEPPRGAEPPSRGSSGADGAVGAVGSASLPSRPKGIAGTLDEQQRTLAEILAVADRGEREERMFREVSALADRARQDEVLRALAAVDTDLATAVWTRRAAGSSSQEAAPVESAIARTDSAPAVVSEVRDPRERAPAAGMGIAPMGATGSLGAPRSPATAGAAAPRTYVVQRGDVLSTIAQKTLGSARRMNEIVALNPGLDPDRVVVGRTLILPPEGPALSGSGPVAPAPATAPPGSTAGSVAARAPAGAAPSPATAAAPLRPQTPAGRTYVVQAGDTLSKIAARELGDGRRWREIVEQNPGLNPDRVPVGKRLALPAAPSSAAPPPPAVASATPTPRPSASAPEGSSRVR